MSKSTRMTPEQLRLMGLEPDGNGGYRNKKINVKEVYDEISKIQLPDISETPQDFNERIFGKGMDKDDANAPEMTYLIGSNEFIGGVDPASDEQGHSTIIKRWADGTMESVSLDGLPRPDLIEEMNNISRYHNVEIKHERQKVYVAIDPGKSGAIVFLDLNGGLNKWVMPKMGDDIDGNALYSIIDGIKDKFDPVIIIEDVHSVFGASAKANWQFGFVCGLIRAMVIAHKLPFHMIQPKDWQKVVWSNDDKVYKPKKPDQKRPQLDTKATSLKAAVRLYPNYDLRATERSKIPHDGIVDAMLMATAAKRMNL